MGSVALGLAAAFIPITVGVTLISAIIWGRKGAWYALRLTLLVVGISVALIALGLGAAYLLGYRL